jgi:capsular exopolysaccharide synthesis family protein
VNAPVRNNAVDREALPYDVPAASTAVDEWHLVDVLRVLYKRRWTALITFVTVILAVVVLVWTAPAIYEARTQLLIERDQPQIIVFKDAINPNADTSQSQEYHETQLKILRSRSLARKTIAALDLWDHPELGPGGERQHPGWRAGARMIEVLTAWLPGALRPSTTALRREPAGPDEPSSEAAAIDGFLAALTVSPVAESLLVDVQFRSQNPELAAKVANALAQIYIEEDARLKFDRSKQASDWLDKQLEAQRHQMELSEAALQRYRDRTDAISTDQREVLGSQKMSEMNAAFVRAKTDRLQKEAIYREAESLSKDRAALETFPAIASNALIQSVKAELAVLERERLALSSRGLGERHPEVVKLSAAAKAATERIRTETAKAVDGLRRDYLAALAQEQSLAGAFADQRRETVQQQRKETEYDVLERAARTDRQIFESLLQRAKETGVSGDQSQSNLRVVDPADVPRTPVSPQKRRSLIMASVGGFMLAVGLAFFFEYFDNRIKTPDEIKAHFGLPCLGMVPLVATEGNGSDAPMLHKGVSPSFAEAVRIIRTNLLFANTPTPERTLPVTNPLFANTVAPARILAVTSAGPSEGKTVVSTNIALSLALTGERVLLIDADLRRPKVHEYFGIPQEPGLADVVTSPTRVSQAAKPTGVSHLWVMPCGVTVPNPTEVLSSARFRKLLIGAAGQFDWVIVDTPPVLAVADSAIVANMTNGVLFVVAAELTGRRIGKLALEQLQAAKAHVIGAVLNRVNLKRNSFYYFDYHREDYARYYALPHAPTPPPPAPDVVDATSRD